MKYLYINFIFGKKNLPFHPYIFFAANKAKIAYKDSLIYRSKSKCVYKKAKNHHVIKGYILIF